MTQDRFGYWPEGSAYRTKPEPPIMAPICPSCGARHRGATVNCTFTNTDQETDGHDDAAG